MHAPQDKTRLTHLQPDNGEKVGWKFKGSRYLAGNVYQHDGVQGLGWKTERMYIQHHHYHNHDDHDHSHCKCCVNGEGQVGDVPHSAVEHKADKKINIWLNFILF